MQLMLRDPCFSLPVLLLLAMLGMDQQAAYFPHSVFSPRDKSGNKYMTTKLGTNLITLREPSLWMRSSKDRAVVAYRLLWIASNRDPVCVRVTKTGSVFSLRLSRHDRSFNGLAGKVTVSKEVKLTEKQWKQLADSVQATKFWTAPAEIEEERGRGDGDIILIEGVKNGKYHVIERSGSTAGESY